MQIRLTFAGQEVEISGDDGTDLLSLNWILTSGDVKPHNSETMQCALKTGAGI